jgi:uncharacterized protein YukE
MGLDVIIPPLPRGDPGGMRELAANCRSAANGLGTIGDDLTSLPKSMTFEGRAATAFADHLQSFSSQLANAAAELQDDAGRLDTAASEVERLLAERDAAIRRAAAEATQAAQVAP